MLSEQVYPLQVHAVFLHGICRIRRICNLHILDIIHVAKWRIEYVILYWLVRNDCIFFIFFHFHFAEYAKFAKFNLYVILDILHIVICVKCIECACQCFGMYCNHQCNQFAIQGKFWLKAMLGIKTIFRAQQSGKLSICICSIYAEYTKKNGKNTVTSMQKYAKYFKTCYKFAECALMWEICK